MSAVFRTVTIPLLPADGGFGVSQARTAITTTGTINNQELTTGWLEYTGTADTTISGFVAQADGTRIRITNKLSANKVLTLSDEGSGSTAANRIALPSTPSLGIANDQSVELVYSATASRWVLADCGAAWSMSGNQVLSGTMTLGNTNSSGSMSLQGRINGTTWLDVSGADRILYGQSGVVALSFGSVGRKAYDTSGVESIDWHNGYLKLTSGTLFNTVQWLDCYLVSKSSGQTAFNWDTGVLNDPATGNAALDLQNGYLYDAGGSIHSVEMFNRRLVNSTSQPILKWEAQELYAGGGTQLANFANAGGFRFSPAIQIGRTSFDLDPVSALHIDKGNATASDIRFTAGTTTGVTSSDGFQIGITTAGVAELRQREGQALEIYTNNTLRAQWASAGTLLIDGSTQARGGAGTATTPFWGFSSSTDCGMYRGSGSSIGFSTTGTKRLFIYSAGQANFAPVAAPSLPLNGDFWMDSTQGTVQAYVSAVKQDLVGCLFTQTASVTVANTVTETALQGAGVGTLSIPMTFFVAGKKIRISASGVHSSTASPTITIRVKLGATTIMTMTGTSGNGTNDTWILEGEITCRTTGSSGTVFPQGIFEEIHTNGLRAGSDSTSTVTINTGAILALTLTVEWGTASASNTITCSNLSVEVLK